MKKTPFKKAVTPEEKSALRERQKESKRNSYYKKRASLGFTAIPLAVRALTAKDRKRKSDLKHNEVQKQQRLEKREKRKLEKDGVTFIKPPKLKKTKKKRAPAEIKKSEEKKFETRNIDLNTLVAVVISPKLTVHVKPGTDIEKVREKYSNR